MRVPVLSMLSGLMQATRCSHRGCEVQWRCEKSCEIDLWPRGCESVCPFLTGRLVSFLRGVGRASPSNPPADRGSPRASTQWLSQETYCTDRAFSKVTPPLLDLIYWLDGIFSSLPRFVPLTSTVWLSECLNVESTYIIVAEGGQSTLWLWLCNITTEESPSQADRSSRDSAPVACE